MTLQKGFSLIELAIVLAIVALFTGGAINAYSRWVEKELFEAAVADIEEAKNAVLGYAITEGHLPCSDISNAIDGQEDRTVGNCTNLAAGESRILPYRTLGLTFTTDPWGNPYYYRAHPIYSDSDTSDLFELSDTAGLTIDDGLGTDIAESVAFIIYSFGPDQGQVDTVEQAKNLDNVGGDDNEFSKTATFLPFNENDAADPNDDSGFDDIVSWVSVPVLKLYMANADILPRD